MEHFYSRWLTSYSFINHSGSSFYAFSVKYRPDSSSPKDVNYQELMRSGSMYILILDKKKYIYL